VGDCRLLIPPELTRHAFGWQGSMDPKPSLLSCLAVSEGNMRWRRYRRNRNCWSLDLLEYPLTVVDLL
jgi:hypothetical protein